MLAIPAIRELDSVQGKTPLGVRFWDLVHERHVNDGLLVTATAVDVSSLPRIALPNRTGGFGFRTLPGLRDSEFGAQDSPFWASPPVQRDFMIGMTDPQERFLPIKFRATAPHPGWFAPSCKTQIGNLPGGSIALFPTPSRALAPGLFAVRADLWDWIADGPAAWALVQVRVSGQFGVVIGHGLSDHDGRLLAAFPNSEPLLRGRLATLETGTGSPHIPAMRMEFAIFYRRLFGGRVPPELRDILSQPAAIIVDHPSNEMGRGSRDSQFVPDFHLRSSSDSLGRVLIQPA